MYSDKKHQKEGWQSFQMSEQDDVSFREVCSGGGGVGVGGGVAICASEGLLSARQNALSAFGVSRMLQQTRTYAAVTHGIQGVRTLSHYGFGEGTTISRASVNVRAVKANAFLAHSVCYPKGSLFVDTATWLVGRWPASRQWGFFFESDGVVTSWEPEPPNPSPKERKGLFPNLSEAFWWDTTTHPF